LTGNTPCEGACIDPAGYDAGKKITGKKRHILVDTQGLLMHAIVHAADIQDRDGGAVLMATLFGAFQPGGRSAVTARPDPAKRSRSASLEWG
jgi:Transposase DDE domain